MLKFKHHMSFDNKFLTKQRGFSLVELMIGLVIGLIATLVIVNVFTAFEQQKRATTGSSDAQTNGAIALFNLQRDAQAAGYGLPVYDTEFTPFRCGTENDSVVANRTTFNHDNDAATPEIGLSPIVIVDGGLNGSDQVAIRSGNSARGGVSMQFFNAPTDTADVDTNLGCAVNDVALIVSSANNSTCRMARVTVAVAGGNTITFNPAVAGIPSGGKIACLGRWNEFRYTVVNNELTRSGALVAGVPSATALPIVSDIVGIQAQYGISNIPGNNLVTQWVNATGAWANINNVDARNQIKAVRVAFIARNGLLEAANVTATCSSLTAANPTGLCAWAGSAASPAPAINLTADANWRRYRYRVYETIIPIKNIIWSWGAL